MAENEFLDLGKARRWQQVLRALDDGKSAKQIASLVAVSLRKTINALHKPGLEGGPPQVPLADLFNAVGDPCELERIVRRYCYHDFVHLFHSSTIGVLSREVAAEKFISAIWEKYSDQIAIHAVQADGKHTFAQVRCQLDQVQAHLRPEIKRIARQLATDPKRTLRRRRSDGTNKPTINTQSVLGESLLGIRR